MTIPDLLKLIKRHWWDGPPDNIVVMEERLIIIHELRRMPMCEIPRLCEQLEPEIAQKIILLTTLIELPAIDSGNEESR